MFKIFGQGVVSIISDFGLTVEGFKLSLQGLGFGIKVLDSGSVLGFGETLGSCVECLRFSKV